MSNEISSNSISSVKTEVRYIFGDTNSSIEILSNTYPIKYLIPDPEYKGKEDDLLFVIFINKNKSNSDTVEFSFYVKENNEEDSFVGPITIIEGKNINSLISGKLSFLWKEASIGIEYVEGSESDEGRDDVIIISLSSKEIDWPDYFKNLKSLNKNVVYRPERTEYKPICCQKPILNDNSEFSSETEQE